MVPIFLNTKSFIFKEVVLEYGDEKDERIYYGISHTSTVDWCFGWYRTITGG